MNTKEYFPQKLSYSFLKISAFTIWDMLTAMIISSLLISTAYMFLLKVHTTTAVDEKIHKQLEELILFEKQIYNDFRDSDQIFMEQNIICFDFGGDFTFLELNDTLCIYFPTENGIPEVIPLESYNILLMPHGYDLIKGLEIMVTSDNNHSYPLMFTKVYDKKKLYHLEKNDDRYK